MKRHSPIRRLNILIALTCCFSLGFWEPSAPLRVASAQLATTDLKQIYDLYKVKETAFRTAASAYDLEISKFQKVKSMQLTSSADAKSIIEEMQKVSRSGVKRLYDKTVVLAMNNTAFKAGVESAAARNTPKKLLAQIQQDPKSLTQIPGYDSARDAIKKNVAADNLLLNQVSTKLKDFAKGASNAAPSRALLVNTHHRASKQKCIDPSSQIRASNSIPVAELNSLSLTRTAGASLTPQTGLIEAALVSAAVLIIGAYAARRVEDITKPADPTNEADTRTRYEVCVDEAYTNRDRCLATHNDFLGDLLCLGIFTADILICNGLPN